MKTMKNIFYALFAVAALVMVGCTKDQTYTPGEDLSGEQIYIDNTTSTFYVQTAAEKEEEAKELKKLSKGLKKDEVYADDTYVDLKIVRKNSKLAQFDFDVKLTMLAEDAALFTLPAGSTQTGADQANETVIFTIPCSFDADAAETVLRLGFDITKLSGNTNYEFIAELADLENSSNYGADAFEFAICHQVVVELPFVDVGTVTIEETIFRDMFGVPTIPYTDCLIQIHKDDKKAIEDARLAGTAPVLDAGYVRFYVPRFMYQIASASVAAGDGVFVEEELDYYAQGCGLMLCMTTNYEPIAEAPDRAHPHPMNAKTVKTGYSAYPVVPVSSIDGSLNMGSLTGNEIMYLGTVPLTVQGYGETFVTMFPLSYGFGTTSRTMNTYSFGVSYWAIDSPNGTLWPMPINITWDKNTLEDDWANYFKVDYNNDINYGLVGSGVFTSEYQNNFATKPLYKGTEEVSGNTVYYVYDAYDTATDQTGNLGLALTWNGTTATVAEMQPLNIQWNGRELYASQSQKIKSSITFNDNGNITKITFGVAVVNEDGAVLGDYTETFDIEASAISLDDFLGEFTQEVYELYGPYDQANQSQSLINAFYPLSSTVTIEQATDESGNPIANKVHIKGMIPDEYCFAAGGYLEGTYDPSTNTIDVPAQFFHDLEWDGTQFVGQPITMFPYFQPGLTNYGAYNTQQGPMWISELGDTASSIAIHYQNGMLVFDSSSNDPKPADGYSIILGYYDAAYDEFVIDPDNMTLFSTISWPSIGVSNPTLAPASAGGGVMPLAQPKFLKKTAGSVNAKASFEARKARGEKIAVANKIAKK